VKEGRQWSREEVDCRVGLTGQQLVKEAAQSVAADPMV